MRKALVFAGAAVLLGGAHFDSVYLTSIGTAMVVIALIAELLEIGD